MSKKDDAPQQSAELSTQIKLQLPFAEEEISWKPGTVKDWGNGNVSGLFFPYIGAPKYRSRLDTVLGFGGWDAKYTQTEKGLTLCDLSLQITPDMVVTRQGVGDHTARQAIEGDKELDEEHGSRTRAFRDACKQFGIGGHEMDGLVSGWTKVDAYQENGKWRVKGLLESLSLASCKYSGAQTMASGAKSPTAPAGKGSSPFDPNDWANVTFKAGKHKDMKVGELSLDTLRELAQEEWVQKYSTYKNAINKAIEVKEIELEDNTEIPF
jgi:hypothetical protein